MRGPGLDRWAHAMATTLAVTACGGSDAGDSGAASSGGRAGGGALDASAWPDAAAPDGVGGSSTGGARSGGNTPGDSGRVDAARGGSGSEAGVIVDSGDAGPPLTATGCFPDGAWWPLSGASVATMQDSYSFRTSTDLHSGIDLPVPMGSDALSILPGTVVEVRQQPACGHDQIRVTVSHAGDGCTFYSVYNHLVSTAVTEGDAVGAGAVLGQTGWNCDPTFEHLHFELRLGCRLAECAVHPLRVLPYAHDPAVHADVSILSVDASLGVIIVQTTTPREQPDLIRVRCAMAGSPTTAADFDLEEYHADFELGQPLPSVTFDPDPYGLGDAAQTVRYAFSGLSLTGATSVECWAEGIQGDASPHAAWP